MCSSSLNGMTHSCFCVPLLFPFLQESNLPQTQEALIAETGVVMNTVDDIDVFVSGT